MSAHPITERLAVCSWSLQPAKAEELLDQLRLLNLSRVQIALDPIRIQPGLWESFRDRCDVHKVRMVSGMMVTVGEDYSSLESIRQTGGVVPDATWEQNWAHFQANLLLAEELGLNLVTFHAGFLPEDPQDPAYQKLKDRLARIADHFGEEGMDLGLETGQESAVHLRELLEDLQRPNLGVNFDPANMILYDKGDPIDALRTLGSWLKQCHIKDATRSTQTGSWGEEVAVGTGEVPWQAFFQTLRQIGFEGGLAIEREAGVRRLDDIAAARRFLESLAL